ncbi:MAG: GC-type dockerin domain-anchored protein [Planctomycetota bacterium]
MIAAGASVAGAQTALPVVNPSFEDENVVFVSTEVAGWVEGGPTTTEMNPLTGGMITGQLDTGVFDNTPTEAGPAKPGSDPEPSMDFNDPFPQVAFIRNTFDAAEPVSLSQTVPGSAFEGAKTYVLSVLVSESLSGFAPPLNADAILEISIGYDPGTGFIPLATRAIETAEIDGTRYERFEAVVVCVDPGSDPEGQPIVIRFRPTVGGTGSYELDGVTLVSSDAAMPCNAADLAAPFGVLNASDINAFVTSFLAGAGPADTAPPEGVLNASDINAFVSAFLAGCP